MGSGFSLVRRSRRLIIYYSRSSVTLVWIRIRSDSPKSLDLDPDTSKSIDYDPDPDAMDMIRYNALVPYPETGRQIKLVRN